MSGKALRPRERPPGSRSERSSRAADRRRGSVAAESVRFARNNRCVQPVTVRRAHTADQPTITAIVRRGRLNPADLQWQRFVIAERDGHAVGVAQLRAHPDGCTELASLVVEPDSRGHGIAAQMVDALLAEERAPVYALIDRRFVDHFARWRFALVDPRQLPRSVLRIYRVGRVVTAVGSVLRQQRIRIVPVLRPDPSPESGLTTQL